MEIFLLMIVFIIAVNLYLIATRATYKPSKPPLSKPVNLPTEQPLESLSLNLELTDPELQWLIPIRKQTINYEKYIKSLKWTNNPARKEVLKFDNYSCRMCYSKAFLNVHHIHYDNLGNELPQDLVTLCEKCHTYTHLMAGKGAKTYPPLKHP